MTSLALREAVSGDVDLLYEWRNEPATRAQSFNQGEVDRAVHETWFAEKLKARDRTRIWILTEADRPVGQIRYEKRDGAAEVSVSIDAAHRGRGFGRAILEMSAPRACRELGVAEVRGLVKLANAASLTAFERAGFRRIGETDVNGARAAVFVWRCVS